MISAAEKQERLESIEDVIGTHRAEGITFDQNTLKLMEQYANGDLSLSEFSTAMRAYAATFGQSQVPLVSAA